MCYSVYFSTDCPQDFSTIESGAFNIARPNDSDTRALPLLAHPHRWLLLDAYGCCSCNFRHAESSAYQDGQWVPGAEEFGPVEDWCPEDEEDIERTFQFLDVVAPLVRQGYKLDLVDLWIHEEIEKPRDLIVDLALVPREHFKFFHQTRFEFIWSESLNR